MKKYLWIVVLALGLCGCSGEPAMETVCDELLLPAMAEPMEIGLDLPGDAAAPVSETDSGRLYLCQDYEIMVQTLSAGDLNTTMETLTGCSREKLTVMETSLDGIDRYEFVWAAAGETGDRLGRGVILDDGNYHYCLSALWDADSREKSQINWNQVFSSFGPVSY